MAHTSAPTKKNSSLPPASTAKSVFMHLLMIAMLYVGVIAFLVLVFQYSNILFEDPLDYFTSNFYDGIRWGSSVLLVAFPVLLWATHSINTEIYRKPTLRNRVERRWLLHLTLFVTGLTIIIDLMVLIYNFYGGELTARFATKTLAVLLVAAATLSYYRWELKRDYSATNTPMHVAIATGILLLGAIIAGFFIAGTPAQQRAVRFDEQRVDDMQSMHYEVLNYVDVHGELPEEYVTIAQPLTDPLTDEAYEYHATPGQLTYELCATFETEVSDTDAEYGNGRVYTVESYPGNKELTVQPNTWGHSEGYYCYSRTITLADSAETQDSVNAEQ